ncbi:MAG TPA: hypothetical protein VF784_05515 [Anaerolineales bacterium]
MSIHALDLLDLPTLYRYRGEAISLDSVRLLTRGNPLGAIGVMAYVNPRRHIYSAVSRDDGPALAGGIIHTNGDSFAKLLYLAPASQMEHPALPALIENLTAQAGTWGAMHVLAEVDETSPAFVPLRKAGFAVYAWQRIWDVTPLAPETNGKNGHANGVNENGNGNHEWRRLESASLPAIQNLFHQIVPPLLQPVESVPKQSGGFVCCEGLRAYVELNTGMVGIILLPLIHPETPDVAVKLESLIRHLPNRGGRPVYVCVRSYQAWLEPALQDLGARAGDRQAIMVKHLARLIKEEQVVMAKQPANVSVQPSRLTRMEGKK